MSLVLAATLAGILVVVSLASALAVTAEPSASPTPTTVPSPGDPQGTWLVAGFDAWGEGLRTPRDRLTVSLLPAGRLEGQSACGTYLGGYTLDGAGIRLAVISRGTGRCGRRAADEEFDLTQALALATTWSATATGLELTDDEGRTRVALLAMGAGGLAGEWLVERYERSPGELVAPLAGATATIAFEGNGRVSGSTGCRPFEGEHVVEADRLVIAPLGVTGLPCQGSVRRQDRRLLELLDAAVLWRRVGDRLTLTDGAGQSLIEAAAVLVAQPSPWPSASPGASAAPGTSPGVTSQLRASAVG